MDKHVTAPIDKETARSLKAGDYVYISGTIYTARDAAHKRMDETLRCGGALPVDIKGQMIYYMGPSPAREGRPIGSAGPTTASRMDKYTPRLLELGMGAMIGKGKRSPGVIDAIVRNGAVYFAAVGGAGALLSKCITSSEVIAYDDLGTEAIRRLTVEGTTCMRLRSGNIWIQRGIWHEAYFDDGAAQYPHGTVWMDTPLLQGRTCE